MEISWFEYQILNLDWLPNQAEIIQSTVLFILDWKRRVSLAYPLSDGTGPLAADMSLWVNLPDPRLLTSIFCVFPSPTYESTESILPTRQHYLFYQQGYTRLFYQQGNTIYSTNKATLSILPTRLQYLLNQQGYRIYSAPLFTRPYKTKSASLVRDLKDQIFIWSITYQSRFMSSLYICWHKF